MNESQNIREARERNQSMINEEEKKENRAAKEEREYWERKANTFPDKKRKQWSMLDNWLGN